MIDVSESALARINELIEDGTTDPFVRIYIAGFG